MQKYSLTVLTKDKVSEADRNGIFDSLKKNFTSLIKEDLWGVRSLAYPIKHNDRAFYAHFEFETTPETIITLDKNIRLNEDIIRHLIVRIDAKRIKTRAKKKEDKIEAEVKIEESKEEVGVKKENKTTKNIKKS